MVNPVFILSTGRTGTQFFEDYISDTSKMAFCLHEPHPSRRFKFYSNMYLEGKISDEKIISQFLKCRRKIFPKTPEKKYIESSNFMFGCIPSLSTHFKKIGVIHIIRHPETYVKSHLNHGFWRGYKKFFARHVPFWLEQLDVKDPNDPVELLAARWVLVNQQIASYASIIPYLSVRFEDLFSSDPSSSIAEIRRIREFCDIEPAKDEDTLKWINKPKNISRKKTNLTNKDHNTIVQNTADAASTFGYTLR